MAAKLRQQRRFGWIYFLVVPGLVAIGGGFAAGNSAAQSSEEATVTPAPEGDGSPTPLPTVPMPPTPTPAVSERPGPPPGIPNSKDGNIQRPFGPMEAEPYRVFTGDGDCLNVRYIPGTTFESNDPRTCVPEGFLLWLEGPEKVVDGQGWRYALGEGWVASQYVVPAPEAVRGMGPFNAVTVGQQAGSGTVAARVGADGSVTEYSWLPYMPEGFGQSPAASSPDGQWAAFPDRMSQQLIVRNLLDGSEQKYPRHSPISWSDDGKLLVRTEGTCNGCAGPLGWLRPSNGVVNEIPNTADIWPAWAPGGQSVVASVEGTKLVQVFLDGTRREFSFVLEEGAYLGDLTVSPDGTKVLSASFLGDVRIIDLDSGVMTVMARAIQSTGKGGCGGSTGKLSAWLDDDTVIWHEAYGEKGENGITIASISTGERRVIPFFSISDMKVAGPGYVSFTTREWFEDKPELMLTWLLDTASGEARPVTVGGYGTWQ